MMAAPEGSVTVPITVPALIDWPQAAVETRRSATVDRNRTMLSVSVRSAELPYITLTSGRNYSTNGLVFATSGQPNLGLSGGIHCFLCYGHAVVAGAVVVAATGHGSH